MEIRLTMRSNAQHEPLHKHAKGDQHAHLRPETEEKSADYVSVYETKSGTLWAKVVRSTQTSTYSA
jgi:hypothetical protein